MNPRVYPRVKLSAFARAFCCCIALLHVFAFDAAARNPAPVRTPEEISAAREYFLLARESERMGDPAAALAWYSLAFRHDAGSRDLCFIYLDHLREAGEVDSSVATARACVALVGHTTSLTFSERKVLGEVALRAEDGATALRHYRSANALNEDDADVLYMLAGLLEEAGDWEGYAAAVERLLPRLDYPQRLMERLARAYGQLGRPEALIPALRAGWEVTGQPSYGRALAGYYDTKGMELSMLEVAERLASVEPAGENAWLLARAYAVANRPEQALAVTVLLLKDTPDNAGVRSLQASLLFEVGRYKEAYKAAARLAKEYPDEASYEELAGSAALELGKRDARERLAKALKLAPLSPDARARAGYAEYALGALGALGAFGHRSEAVARSDSLLAYPSGDSLGADRARLLEGLAHARLARDLSPRGGWERPSVFADSAAARRERRMALERFEAVLARNSGQRTGLFEAGALREQLGDRAGAKSLLRDLVARDTLHALGMNYLAYTIVEQDTTPATELAEAGALLDRALALDPENGAYLDSKGWWFFKTGANDSARVFLERAAFAMPGDPAVLDHLVKVMIAQDDRHAACILWRRLRAIDPKHAVLLQCPVSDGARETQ